MISVTGQEEEAEAGGQMSVHRTQIAVLCSSKASELDAASWTCWSWHRHSASQACSAAPSKIDKCVSEI